MRLALTEAEKAEREGEVPIGAVLVAEGEVIAQGYNQPIALSDPSAHAEILALRRGAAKVGNYRIPGGTLYVTIEPCVMCAGAILQARIKRLVYGARDPKGGGVRSLFSLLEGYCLNHRVEVLEGVRAQECQEIVQRFFRQKRGKNDSFTAESAEKAKK
jgi:tRNA(adenine34) deaminase